MFPYAEHSPALLAEEETNDSVALFVPGNFRMPKLGARLGQSAMPSAPVPEASINKDGEVVPGEDEIRPTGEVRVAAPPGDAGCAKQ
jgi:hypothetical protein